MAEAEAVGALQDAEDIAHVRREGAEALLDALLVADVREDVLEDDGPRAVVYGEVEARLGHEGEQANGLEGDSFPARVRPGDDQHAEAVAQFDRDGHHVARKARAAGVLDTAAFLAIAQRPTSAD